MSYNNLESSDTIEKVLSNASKVASKYGGNQVGSEHLLYGLICVTGTLAYKLLHEYGIEKESLIEVFEDNAEVSFFASTEVEFTPRAKEIFRLAQKVAVQLNHSFVGAEHLLLAILSSSGSFAVRILASYFKANVSEMREKLLDMLQNASANIEQPIQNNDKEAQSGSPLPEKLLAMGSDITWKAKVNKMDPIIGREFEIERIIQILCRKTKNNPVLIGEAGVGKTAVVEGLAQAIVNGDVPELLRNKTIYSLEIGGLMAGTKYRGAMEEKLKDVIETIVKDKSIIVFIDEIHTLAMAGSEKGETSPADMLKPYLARGEFQTIGATTTDEYRKYIEKDKALERRFQPIMVTPPTVEQTIEILKGLRDSYEVYHHVKIADSAIESAATLSDRYIADRSLPDKAIDLIDEACSKARVDFNMKPSKLREIESKLKQLYANRDEASINRNYEKAARLQTEIIKLESQQKQASEEFNKKATKHTGIVGAQEIAEVVSAWTRIPVTKITETERDKLQNLENILHKRVIGQDEAVESVAKAIRRSRVGLQDNKRPIGSFLFMGPTGVGKTELCKAIAEAMFDDENNIIRVDMSEYMEQHSVSKLIGSPPGYVGYEEGGQLTEQVRRKPYSVVLFDEIEKAHSDIFNALLQVLDEGWLTDGQGRKVNFRNTIIIMTSNIGAGEVERKRLGFGGELSESPEDFETIRTVYLEAMKKKFKPEFINRIDVISVFHSLSEQDLTKIATIMIANINKRLKKQELELKITQEALLFIIQKGCCNKEYGARPLKRFIQQEVEDCIAEKIINGELNKTGAIIIDIRDNRLTFISQIA